MQLQARKRWLDRWRRGCWTGGRTGHHQTPDQRASAPQNPNRFERSAQKIYTQQQM